MEQGNNTVPGVFAPVVSVCLMTYNRAHYLPAAIEGWLAQTYPNFELIISNDASTDDTDRICQEYAKQDDRIRYIKQEKNLGFLLCYKFILNQARGKYFIWASDDDLWDKRFLEDCMSVHEANPDLIMVFADMVDIDKGGKTFRKYDATKYLPLEKDTYERLKRHMLMYFDDGKLQLIFGLWKREAILDDPLFGYLPDKREYYWGFDNYFVFRNLAKGPVGYVPEIRFFRRSRVLEDTRPPRLFIPRLAVSFYHRLQKIFASPYFYYVMRRIWDTKTISPFERFKLTLWNLFVMVRIFFARKI
jgi:glycosyltransferase involved in cell wall biosynthesis